MEMVRVVIWPGPKVTGFIVMLTVAALPPVWQPLQPPVATPFACASTCRLTLSTSSPNKSEVDAKRAFAAARTTSLRRVSAPQPNQALRHHLVARSVIAMAGALGEHEPIVVAL